MEKGLEGSGKVPRIVQVMYFKGLPKQVSQQPDMGLPQQWEAQWQEFLKALQPAHMAWGNPELTDPVPWDDAKGFLAAFEQVAEACRWPREEWVKLLLPALRGGVEQYFCRLDARERGDYLKVKAAILRGDTFRADLKRQHFRQCSYQEREGPRRIYGTLQELCRQWLKPEKHTKEQILELIIKEQLLAMLPPEVQTWVQERGPEDCIEMVALAEDFLMGAQQCHPAKRWDWQGQTVSSMGSDGPQQQHYANRNSDREISLMANEMTPTRNSGLPFPPEGQEVACAGPAEEPEDVKDVLNLDQKPPVPWEIMRENYGSSSALEGLLFPTPETISQPEQQRTISAQSPEHGETVPGNFWGGRILSEIKTEQADSEAEDSFEALPAVSPDVLESRESRVPLNLESHELSPGRNFHMRKLQGKQLGKSTPCQKKNVKKKGKYYPAEKKHTCSECGHKAYYLSDLLRHMKVHSNKRHQCPECGKTYKDKSSFENHKKIHLSPGNPSGRKTRLETRSLGGADSSQLQRESTDVDSETSSVSRLRPRTPQRLGVPGIKTLRVVLTKLASSRKGNHHKCPECPFTSVWLSEVVRHMRIHAGERPYQCLDCGKAYRWASNLRQHRRTSGCSGKRPVPDASIVEPQVKHTGEEKLQTMNSLQETIKLEDMHGRSPAASLHTVSLSHETYENRPALWEHQRKGAGGSHSRRRTAAKKSTKFQGKKEHTCSECGYTSKRLSDIIIHGRIHTGERPYVCLVCGKAFRWLSNIRKHEQTHTSHQQASVPNNSVAPAPSVAECDVTLSDDEELINILAKNRQRGGTSPGVSPAAASLSPEASEIRAISKPRPGEGSGRSARLQRNAVAVTKNRYAHLERKHECPDCGHRTFYLSDLVRHQRTHTGERPYRCRECGKTFAQKSSLTSHLKTHKSSGGSGSRQRSVKRKKGRQGERKHTCSKCGHKTYKLSTLLVHMKVHVGEKPFKCLECGQTFSWSSNLSRHKRLHLTSSSTSNRNESLSKHQKNRAGDRKPREMTDADPLLKRTGDTSPATTCTDSSNLAAMRERWCYNKQPQREKAEVESKASAEGHDGSGSIAEAKDNLEGKEAAVRARLEKFAYSKGEEVDDCQLEVGTNQMAKGQAKLSYECPVCGKSFRAEHLLVDHQNSHTWEKPYKCGKSFSWNNKLERHQIVHTGVKPFHCSEYRKDFYRKDSLTSHLKTHGSQPEHERSECGQSFDQRDQLERHQRSHVGSVEEAVVAESIGAPTIGAPTQERENRSEQRPT